MVATLPAKQTTSIVYPSSDGEPLAESYAHLLVLIATLEVLRQYLEGQQAIVLANQFLYYAQGFPKMRVAPDVMVIYNVAPGGRDNYKVWEEGVVPSVIFEMTSQGTKNRDEGFKKDLYEQMGVKEYWLFDPKGEWIEGQLQGYRLIKGEYEAIADGCSEILKLQLRVEENLIGFYRQDTGEKLLIPTELAQALKESRQEVQQERQERQQAQQEAQQAQQEAQQAQQAQQEAQQEAEKLAAKLRKLGIDPEEIT
ncbi:MAG: Uma2 family endonuclease [Okeania sp. SIO2D1]|nr:Uma2 family endonuclease [Okeania sp. SIO2D1]